MTNGTWLRGAVLLLEIRNAETLYMCKLKAIRDENQPLPVVGILSGSGRSR
jgi:hypothetical protein